MRRVVSRHSVATPGWTATGAASAVSRVLRERGIQGQSRVSCDGGVQLLGGRLGGIFSRQARELSTCAGRPTENKGLAGTSKVFPLPDPRASLYLTNLPSPLEPECSFSNTSLLRTFIFTKCICGCLLSLSEVQVS